MGVQITSSDDPVWLRNKAYEFLVSQPVLHNMILTLLEARIACREDGRYWVATDGGTVAGVVLQSPLNYDANLTPMPREVVEAMVDAISESRHALPGVNGEAATAARFAGRWTERNKCAAVPTQGLRIYEVDHVNSPAKAEGRLRQAVATDRDKVVDLMRDFYVGIGEQHGNLERIVDMRLAAGQFWLWEAGGPVSLAASSLSVAGVVRVQAAYTPAPLRNRGYGAACVAALSKQVRASGQRCMLYTDLGNPISNAVFRRIGYRCVADGLRYRFV